MEISLLFTKQCREEAEMLKLGTLVKIKIYLGLKTFLHNDCFQIQFETKTVILQNFLYHLIKVKNSVFSHKRKRKENFNEFFLKAIFIQKLCLSTYLCKCFFNTSLELATKIYSNKSQKKRNKQTKLYHNFIAFLSRQHFRFKQQHYIKTSE